MLHRSKALAVAAVAAATLASAVPASAWDGTVTAAGPCRSDIAMNIEEWHQTVFVTGAFTAAGAIDVDLTCGIVRYGETVARIPETSPGPAAALAGSARVLGGPISTCHEIRIDYVDRVDYRDTCP